MNKKFETSLKKNADYEIQHQALVEDLSTNEELSKARNYNSELELLYREDSEIIGEHKKAEIELRKIILDKDNELREA